MNRKARRSIGKQLTYLLTYFVGNDFKRRVSITRFITRVEIHFVGQKVVVVTYFNKNFDNRKATIWQLDI